MQRIHRTFITVIISLIVVPPLGGATFNQSELEHLAEREGYGYKAANLMLLKNILTNADNFTVQVPNFSAISSETVQGLLEKSGLDISEEWSRIVANLNLEQSLSSKTFPSWFLDASRALAHNIREKFKSLELGSFSNGDIRELQTLLSAAQKEQWRLMVRSTGKEDTDKLANAGGNLSVANVSPELRAVLTAVGQVIASYFEEKSLSQRLIAGDVTLIEKPLTPVLIQRMVGEPLNNNHPSAIPVGCVLYTEETGGRLASVHTLQCSFGHNEGVVQSLVPLDTFYLPKTGRVKSIIKIKPKRIAPVFEAGVFGLDELANPISIQSKASLTEDAARAISRVGTQIDTFYGKRMDIELIYEPSSKTIFIVQARPLVFPNSDDVPSYIAQPSDFSTSMAASLISVNIGPAAVQRITSSDQILLADTLDSALDLYTRAQPMIANAAPHAVEMMEPPILEESEPIAEFTTQSIRKTVNTIIVSRQADPTSHAAAVFRGDGKTIYITSDFHKLWDWMRQPDFDILIDGQRGLAVNLASLEEHSLDTKSLFERRFLKTGWLNYPLPLRVSVDTHSPRYCLAQNTNTQSLFDDYTCLVDRLQNEVIQLQHFVEVTRAKAHCDDKAQGCLEERIIAQKALPKLENLNTLAHELKSEMRESPSADDVARLVDLFPRRFLEALIYQTPEAELVDAYSVESVKTDYQRRQTFVYWTLKPLIDSGAISDSILRDERLFLMAEAGHNASLTRETTTRFLQLVDELGVANNQNNIVRLQEIVDSLNHLGTLPLWVNSIFIQAAQKIDTQSSRSGVIFGPKEFIVTFLPKYGLEVKDGDTLLNELYQDYEASRASLLILAEKKTLLNTYDPSRFEHPDKFTRNQADLKSQFINYFVSKDFLDFKSPLYAMAATSLMEAFVERFDTSIKALKSTKNYSKKVKDFKALLEDYLNVLDVWAHAAPTDHIFFNPDWPLETYLNRVRQVLADKLDLTDNELLPTPEFSVSGAALGSGANFGYYDPRTLEDLFTLIHQSLNSIMSAYLAQYSTGLKLPADFEHALRSVYQAQGHPFPSDQTFEGHADEIRIILSGVYVDDEGISYSFNVPLRWHSAKIHLGYNKELNKVRMGLQIFGDSYDRWPNVMALCEIKSDLLGIPYIEPLLTPKELLFSFDSVGQINSNDLKDIIIGAIDLTLEKMPSFENDLRSNSAQMEELFERYVKEGSESSFTRAELLIAALLSAGKAVTRAESLVGERLDKLLPNEQGFRLFVLNELVKNNYDFENAQELCSKLLYSADARISALAARVLRTLISKGQSLDLAHEFSLQALRQNEKSMRIERWRVVVELVRAGQTLNEAETLIPVGLESSSNSERYYALQALQGLIEKGHLLDQAEGLASSLLDIRSAYVQEQLVHVSCALVKQRRALPLARVVVEKFKESEDPWVRRAIAALRKDLENAGVKEEL